MKKSTRKLFKNKFGPKAIERTRQFYAFICCICRLRKKQRAMPVFYRADRHLGLRSLADPTCTTVIRTMVLIFDNFLGSNINYIRPLQQPEFRAKLPAKVLVKEMNFFLCPKYAVYITKKNSRRKWDHRPLEMLSGNESEFRLSRNRFRRNSPPFLFVLLYRMPTRRIVLSLKVLKASSSDTCQAITTTTWK